MTMTNEELIRYIYKRIESIEYMVWIFFYANFIFTFIVACILLIAMTI